MHVRVTLIDGVKDIDRAAGVLRDDVLPAVKGLGGFKGITASADRVAGVVGILSIWESEADEKASAGQITQVRDNAVKAIGGTLREVRTYEQAVDETSARPEPGSPLLITPTKMDPAKVDENLEFFKANVLPDIKSTPGFRAVRYLVDRKAGEGMVGVVLADEASVKESEARAEKRRSLAKQQGVELGQRSRREVIFVGLG